jgi:hypothetical protein
LDWVVALGEWPSTNLVFTPNNWFAKYYGFRCFAYGAGAGFWIKVLDGNGMTVHF